MSSMESNLKCRNRSALEDEELAVLHGPFDVAGEFGVTFDGDAEFSEGLNFVGGELLCVALLKRDFGHVVSAGSANEHFVLF